MSLIHGAGGAGARRAPLAPGFWGLFLVLAAAHLLPRAGAVSEEAQCGAASADGRTCASEPAGGLADADADAYIRRRWRQPG